MNVHQMSLDWTTGLDYWTGLLDWTTGLDYWTGLLDPGRIQDFRIGGATSHTHMWA